MSENTFAVANTAESEKLKILPLLTPTPIPLKTSSKVKLSERAKLYDTVLARVSATENVSDSPLVGDNATVSV